MEKNWNDEMGQRHDTRKQMDDEVWRGDGWWREKERGGRDKKMGAREKRKKNGRRDVEAQGRKTEAARQQGSKAPTQLP